MTTLLRTSLGALACAALATVSTAQITNQDNCANAGVDLLGPGSYSYDTLAATTGTEGQAENCAPSGSIGLTNDIWFTYMATGNGSTTISNCISNHPDSRLTVWPDTGGCPTDGTSLICNDDSCGLSSSVTFAVTTGTTYLVQLGNWPDASNMMGGTGTVEIVENVPTPIALLSYYKFDESSGPVCVDSSGLGNDGSYVGGVTLGQTGAAPTTGLSADFNGVFNGNSAMYDGLVTIPGSQVFDDLTAEFSVSAWVNLNNRPLGTGIGASGVSRVFGHEGPFVGWSFGINDEIDDDNDPVTPDVAGLRVTTHGTLDYDQAGPIPSAQWTHVGVTFDDLSDATFYVNGQNVGTAPGVQPADQGIGPYLIGAWTPTFQCGGGTIDCREYLDGRIDDLQIYQGVLSDQDMTTIFNNPGTTVAGPPAGPIGTNYCLSLTNSSGNLATMSAVGSLSVASADLDIAASGLPSNVQGIFYYGLNQITAPFGDGFRCVGGATQRLPFNQANPAGLMTQGDVFSLPLLNVPLAAGTFNFQCWFRDPMAGMSGFNLSDGLSITFIP